LAAATRWLAFGRPAARTPLDVPIALLVVMAGVGLAVSALPAVSSGKLWGIVLGISVYYAVISQAADARWLVRGLQALILLGVGIALVGFVAVDWSAARIVDIGWLNAVYARLPTLVRGLPSSGVPHANDLINARELGGVLALLLPLALVRCCFTPRLTALERGALAAASVCMGGILLLTPTLSAIGGVSVAGGR